MKKQVGIKGLIAVAAISAILSISVAGVAYSIRADPIPVRIFLANSDTELSTGALLQVISTSYNFVDGPHRLIVHYAGTGAIHSTGAALARLYMGCRIDGAGGTLGGTSCIGHQTNPAGVTAGFVNLLSTDFPTQTSWDNDITYTWFTPVLPAGVHTVRILMAVGPSVAGGGGAGTALSEARNLVVTVAVL